MGEPNSIYTWLHDLVALGEGRAATLPSTQPQLEPLLHWELRLYNTTVQHSLTLGVRRIIYGTLLNLDDAYFSLQ